MLPLLVVGDRTPDDEVTYPDIDLELKAGPDGVKGFRRKDGLKLRAHVIGANANSSSCSASAELSLEKERQPPPSAPRDLEAKA